MGSDRHWPYRIGEFMTSTSEDKKLEEFISELKRIEGEIQLLNEDKKEMLFNYFEKGELIQ
mgnify:CR=1 FL=1